ncbi:MAG: hypothetical protein ACOX2Q_12740 [Dehalobacterium sp.]|jgi:hypothetical protein
MAGLAATEALPSHANLTTKIKMAKGNKCSQKEHHCFTPAI